MQCGLELLSHSSHTLRSKIPVQLAVIANPASFWVELNMFLVKFCVCLILYEGFKRQHDPTIMRMRPGLKNAGIFLSNITTDIF